MGSTNAYRILGIDPGLHVTGYAAVDFGGLAASGVERGEPRIIEAGTIRTDARGAIAARIAQIYSDLVELIAELKPDMVAIEQLYAHYRHPRTAILMAHARGMVLLAGEQAGVAVRSLSATSVKKALTGNGHASKLQVQRAVQAVCKLKALPQPPDVADALAIALCASRRR